MVNVLFRLQHEWVKLTPCSISVSSRLRLRHLAAASLFLSRLTLLFSSSSGVNCMHNKCDELSCRHRNDWLWCIIIHWIAPCAWTKKNQTNLFISLASSSGIADGADDPRACEGCVVEEAGTAGHWEAVWMRAWVWIRHWCDDCGLDHPLQVLAGGYGINGWNKGTARSGHVDSVLLKRKKIKKIWWKERFS